MHLSAQRLVTCRWCKRERPATTMRCPGCGPPIVVRMVHDALYGGLLGTLLALTAFLVVFLGGFRNPQRDLVLYAAPAGAAAIGLIVGLVASIAWRWRARRWLKQKSRAA